MLARHILRGALLFAGCQLLLLFLRIMPLSVGQTGWPGPNLGLCLILAWVLRRPAQVPAVLIVAVVLIEDILLLRPLGLWTVIVLFGSEAARQREARWREQPFMIEWLRVAILMGAMMLGYRILQILFLLPVSVLGQVVMQYLATVAAYPLVVLAARFLLGLRRVGAADTEMVR